MQDIKSTAKAIEIIGGVWRQLPDADRLGFLKMMANDLNRVDQYELFEHIDRVLRRRVRVPIKTETAPAPTPQQPESFPGQRPLHRAWIWFFGALILANVINQIAAAIWPRRPF